MTGSSRSFAWGAYLLLATACGASQAQRGGTPTPAPNRGGQAAGPAAATPDSGATPAGRPQGQGQATTGPRPYHQVVTARAKSDEGLFRVHQVGDKHYFEIPDSLMGRDMLLVTRIAGVAEGMGGFLPAGVSLNEQVVRWTRQGDRITLRSHTFRAVADDSLPIHQSVVANNFPAILGSFPIAAFSTDSASQVVDVTAFFEGDTPSLSGLNAGQRRTYQVRRLDPSRSSIDKISSFPLNIEVRHTQTFDAGAPPANEETGTISIAMAQSLVLLPRDPMRPRHADARVGYFTVNQVNYGLDEQKAASQSFIRRWRLEPKDPAAYARGELVEPVKPIIYYLDPATPAKWRPYVRKGIEDWQPVFESAGFRNAIIAMDPPSPAVDPDWSPEDIRYSVVRWSASLTRNAQGPSTSDPRTGEIIESDIVWYHNHMRSYRNRLMIETGAANPAARTLDIPEDLMGETMRQVIAHEVGHALGLPHNMVASSSYPTDSLRSPGFARRMGVSASVMDYARQNYVAQPGDGLEPLDFIRHTGPYDHYSINWGYRVIPEAATPEAERPILHRWIVEKAGDPMYRYLPQNASSDPRSQTEDMGDDPVRSSGYAIANLKRVVPQLIAWTSRPGEDYEDLAEIYSELLGQWVTYVRHVTTVVGGVHVVNKTSDQDGGVYEVVPRTSQREAMAWLGREVLATPGWLLDPAILERVGDAGGVEALSRRQVAVLNTLLDPRRMVRLVESAQAAPAAGYSLPEFLDDLTRMLWQDPGATTDPNRRALQRGWIERVELLMKDEIPAPTNPGFGGGGSPPPNVGRSDIRPLLRAQLVEVRRRAASAGTSADRVTRAHMADVVARIDRILDPRG